MTGGAGAINEISAVFEMLWSTNKECQVSMNIEWQVSTNIEVDNDDGNKARMKKG